MPFQSYTKLLKQFVSFKSISTDPAYRGEIDATAAWLKDLFDQNQFTTEIITGYDNPIVLAQYIADPSLPTVLVYGHYDVQPASKEDGWPNDPFSVEERDGKLYARGVMDNKGQILIHMVTIFELIKEGKLAANVTFLLEGNEETGGSGMSAFLKKNADRVRADQVLVSDGEMPYKPVITASMRGVYNIMVKYTTAKNSLHSGLYGGTVPNAAEELAKLIAKINTKEYQAVIDAFHQGSDKISPEEIEHGRQMDACDQDVIERTGVKKTFLPVGDSLEASHGLASMVTITGMKAGYIGEGFSNIIPSTAEAKINIRIGPYQDTHNVVRACKDFVKQNTPEYVTAEIHEEGKIVEPVNIDITSPVHRRIQSMLKEVYDADVLVEHCGGSLPVIGDLQRKLGIDPLVIGLANKDGNMHGVNENFDIGLIKKGLEFSRMFFSQL